MDAIKVETVVKKVYEILGNENKKTLNYILCINKR